MSYDNRANNTDCGTYLFGHPQQCFSYQLCNKFKDEWEGSATELLSALQDDKTPSNTVTKILNQYHDTFLLENRILYQYSRIPGKRLITLTKAPDDSGATVSDKPSQLS